MSSKITHLKTHGDGWWLNKATDSDGKPRDLGLGLVTLPAGGSRFVDEKTVARSGGAFKNAKDAGLVDGPFATQDAVSFVGTQPPVKIKPAPEPQAPAVDLAAEIDSVIKKAVDTDDSSFTVTPVVEAPVEAPVEEAVADDGVKAVDKRSSKKSKS